VLLVFFVLALWLILNYIIQPLPLLLFSVQDCLLSQILHFLFFLYIKHLFIKYFLYYLDNNNQLFYHVLVVIKMNIEIISACTDLGVHVDGANLGPKELTKNLNLKNFIIEKENITKSKDKENLRKNEKYINIFTKKVFDTTTNILNNNNFPLLIGGDHSCVIGSAIASNNYNDGIGMIWVDAHGDYNTFETTKSGNIHGLPFAAITGYKCRDLTDFITNSYIDPKKCVVVGARSIDPWEIGNMIDAGVTIFTTEDVKNEGASTIMKKAIEIASNNTNGVHISFDLDVIDPEVCPGVSVPAIDGINLEEAYQAIDEIIKHKDKLKSLDLVEYNPLRDIDNKTKVIARTILKSLINNI